MIKIKTWLYIPLIIILVFCVLSYLGYVFIKNLTPEDFLQSDFVQQQVGEEGKDILSLVPHLLGFPKPVTYLLLFQNNTELRPAGGFIGVYAVVKVNKGQTEVIKLEGTEILDKNKPQDWCPSPPEILQEELGVRCWFFRDSNWSPDFTVSAQKALDFYQAEAGVAAKEIDVVAAITPTVLEGLLKLTGPITVAGLEFTAANVTEKLEYEVEYGYKKSGKNVSERKEIIKPLMLQLTHELASGLVFNLQTYFSLINDLVEQKHILAYALDEELNDLLKEYEWSGKIKETSGDYLLWVDANLAALKTDYALERTLSYSLRPQAEQYLARVEMEYIHKGKFDWRTSRYRTYARVYVPQGSQLVTTGFDQGEELGKTWFGKFITIEPGETKILSLEYILPEYVSKNTPYTLFVQKQLGTIDHGLTLELDFGKNIRVAKPVEEPQYHGDDEYTYETDLRVDREFSIEF